MSKLYAPTVKPETGMKYSPRRRLIVFNHAFVSYLKAVGTFLLLGCLAPLSSTVNDPLAPTKVLYKHFLSSFMSHVSININHKEFQRVRGGAHIQSFYDRQKRAIYLRNNSKRAVRHELYHVFLDDYLGELSYGFSEFLVTALEISWEEKNKPISFERSFTKIVQPVPVLNILYPYLPNCHTVFSDSEVHEMILEINRSENYPSWECRINLGLYIIKNKKREQIWDLHKLFLIKK